MKKFYIFIIISMAMTLVACQSHPTAIVTDILEVATPTPEVFIAVTQAIPAQVQLNGVTLAVRDAHLGECDLPDCPPTSPGTRYLRVTLQTINLPAEQALDYKNMPQGIAIRDENASTPFNRLLAYKPSEQQLLLYFAVPQTATVFSLQWPGAAEIPLTVTVDETSAVQPPSFTGTEVSYGPMALVVPPGIADGASGMELPPATNEDAAYWQKTPGHTLIDLKDYYVMQGKTLQPQIYVYPATDYAILVPAAFESMHRLRNVISGIVPTTPDQLPAVPFFNAAQVFASNIQTISFQNGSGVRFLTEYAQYAASVNNQDLIYHFQGFSDDGEYYIIAILPITMPMLAETSDGGAALPPGGIPYTYFTEGGNFNAQDYYARVTDLLNSTPPELFTPTISQLDALIQSMQITP